MCYIELKNDKYETSEDLKHLLQYILRLDKTAEDSQRANTITNTLAGCQPAMIPNEYLCDPSAVYNLMLFEVRRRHKGIPQFAKHRIVSFAATDCILPQDVVSLAERIASIYAKNGYITAYGIHADAKDTDLFVIATTNDTRYMPPSLLRPGRFDYVIYLQPPIGENAENIVSYYLRDKDLAEDVLISDIVKAMPKVSCATLETVMNLAALNSVYQGHEHIQKEDITEALLQVVYKLQKTDKETDSTERQLIAVHEAAHAVVGEVLHPGSIGIVTVRGSQGVIGGMVNGCATYAQNEEEFLDEVTKTLAGRAGVSLIYGVMDIQASADIEQADKLMDIWLCHFAGGGFVGIESGDNRMSEQRLSYNEAIKSAKLEELYRRAYKILHNNKYFLLAVQHGLLEHETLLNSDLAKIRESCI